jgi:uncharacterized protein YdeI (YjbR/CyaY-like superfamily)
LPSGQSPGKIDPPIMASVPVNPDAVRTFKDRDALERWYARHAASAKELWIGLAKKGSGLASVSTAEALDVAICWGWIDAIRKPLDATRFLQRYTPRGAKSLWSVRNREHVARLIAEGRMQPAGQAQIELAKADGRWKRAYAGSRQMEFPADLLTAIEAEPKALDLFKRLTAQNRYALAFRVHNLKTPEGRARKIAEFVAMLKRGETIHPNGRRK